MKPDYFIDGPPGEKLAIYDNQKLNVAQILFIHGNSLSASVFEKQLRDEKLNSYRLIAFDLPGHGNSDRAVDPEKIYTLTGLMETITWVVKKTGLNKPVAVGFSLGAHLIVSHPLANKLFGGAFLFGYPPVSTLQDFMVCGHGSPALPLMFKPDLNEVELSLINHEMQRKEKSPEFSLNAAFTGSDPAF